MSDNPTAKKSLGQHWLYDEAALEAMCQAADVRPEDLVLEIGSGTGSLTALLLNRGAEVDALEFDETLIPVLEKKFEKFSASHFFVSHGDIRTYNFNNLLPGYKIVANIPYYLTANLLRILTDIENKPSVAALLVQKEVAERVGAEPGQMSLISVIAQFYYEVSLGRVVPAELFEPKPKVDSQILVLSQRPSPLFAVDTKEFFRLVKAGFSARRKTLLNSLSAGLRQGKAEVIKWLEAAQIKPEARPQELSLDQWHRLYQVLKNDI